MDIKDISFFEAPVTNTTPTKNIDLKETLILIKSNKYKEICETARKLKAEGKEEECRTYKAKHCDYVTFPGTFTKREKQSWQTSSGLFCADIDNIKDIDEVKEKLKQDPYTLGIFRSVTTGLRVIIKIPREKTTFDDYVVSYYEYLKTKFNIDGKVDSKVKNPSQPCFLSYDPDLFYNDNAERWETTNKPMVQKVEKEADSEITYATYSEATLKAMLKRIPCRGWGEHTFSCMLALIHYGKYRGKDYFGVFRWWIDNYKGGISVEDMQTKWKKASENEVDRPITIRYLVNEAVEHGYQVPQRKNLAFDPLSNVETFHGIQPFFYDRNKIFWLWNVEQMKYEIVDEVDMMNIIEESLGFYGQTVESKIRNEYLECFKRVGRKNIPQEAPKKWIQFMDKAISLKSGKIYDITPDFLFTNPIPHEIGDTTDTPIMDRLFTEWVGEEHAQQLYELLAYCTYSNYPIQLLFCLWGNGRNGKSQFLKILDKFIGRDNTTSTELDLLVNNRFESFKLYKKLVCTIGETNFGILTNTSLIKKLTGGDKIGFEKKNKDPFDDYNYAKMIIASNSLPSTDDTSDGFFRRWLIIDFPNEFDDTGVEIWETVPESEYQALAKKVPLILNDLLKRGKFTGQGTIPERKAKYISVSNPLSLFLKDHCEIKLDAFVSYNKLYTAYVGYLAKHKRRKVKLREFKSALEDEGFYVEKGAKNIGNEWKSGYWVDGLRFLDNLDVLDKNLTQETYVGNEVGTLSKLSEISKNDDLTSDFVSEEDLDDFQVLHTNQKKRRLRALLANGIEMSISEVLSKNFSEKDIEVFLDKGEVFEPRSGYLKLMQ